MGLLRWWNMSLSALEIVLGLFLPLGMEGLVGYHRVL